MDTAQIVIVALPERGYFDPPEVPSPEGMTYQWVNTTLMGDPYLKTLHERLENGWEFVAPSVLPSMLALSIDEAITRQGFCLVAKPTSDIEEQRARERAAHMDVDIRVISIMERYTWEGSNVNVGGVAMNVSVTHRLKDGTEAAPLNTLVEVRAELAKRGFPEADIRLFMKRHFGKGN